MAVQSTLFSLPTEMHFKIGHLLDIVSLLAWGGTCLHFRNHVSYTLLQERDAIIRRYWGFPLDLLRSLTETRAVITGKAALAFVARCPRVLTNELEICVPYETSYQLLALFDEHPAAVRAWDVQQWPAHEENRPTAYLYRTRGQKVIRVICSHTDSAFTLIASYPTCALINYMDQFSFGCAYPRTTLEYQAVTPNLPNLSHSVLARVNQIINSGRFQLKRWPKASTLPPNDQPVSPLPLWASTVCLRQIFQCPGQPRFFGDQGSLLDFYQPDMVDHGVMAHWHHPPYGRTAIWQMESDDCTSVCASGDYLLRRVHSDVALPDRPLHYGPFTTGVIGQVMTGESQHDRVWMSTPDDIVLERRAVLWQRTPYH